MVGTQVYQLAMPLTAVLTLDANPAQLGLLGALTFAPYVVLGLPVGVLVDRWQRRGVLILSSLGQALSIGAIPLLAALDLLTFGWLLALACAGGTARVFFTIAYRSYLPAIVPPEHLTGANSRLTASESVAEIGGPGLGGALVQLLGAPFALLVDAVSYLASAVGVSAVRKREKAVHVDPAPLRSQVTEGFRFTFSSAYLRAALGEAASYNLCWQIVLTILTLFAVKELDMSPGKLGLVLSVGAVGALLGAAFTDRIAHRVGLGRTLVIAAVIGDLAPLLLPVVHRGTWAAPLLAVTFFVQGFGITACKRAHHDDPPDGDSGAAAGTYQRRLPLRRTGHETGRLAARRLAGHPPGAARRAGGGNRGAAEHQFLPDPVPAAQGPQPGQPQARAPRGGPDRRADEHALRPRSGAPVRSP
nr:MFS transporter [Streptomyces sp. SID5470]